MPEETSTLHRRAGSVHVCIMHAWWVGDHARHSTTVGERERERKGGDRLERLSSWWWSGAAPGWSRKPRGLYDGPCMGPRQTDQWSCGFVLDRANRSCTDQQKGMLMLATVLPSSEVPFGAGTRVVVLYFRAPRWPDKCHRMMRQHLSRKALGCTQRANRQQAA
jgi:hypothetical protein